MPDVFISYSREDALVADRLSDMLMQAGLTVFFDRALAAGEDYSDAIERALASATAIVVLLSRSSNRSRWVQAELRAALETGKRVIPVLLDAEGTDNWVWPLISNRESFRLESTSEIEKLAQLVRKAVEQEHFARERPPMARARLIPWRTLLTAILSAIVGALLSWCAM